jgi:hypothetical protein
MSLVSRFIKGGLGTKVYMVTLGGFDTHNNQPTRHQNLMSRLSRAIKTFYDDLQKHGVADKVLSMTFSEFGRRVAENGSSGTDHGSAAPIMLFGPALRGSGFIGKHPELTNLDKKGNMANTTDFRSVYATILSDWLCADTNYINNSVIGAEFNLLGLGLGCNGVENLQLTDDPILPLHAAVNDDQGASLYISINEPSNVEVAIFDILGRRVGSAYNKQLSSGRHTLPLRSIKETRLPLGQYFYKIRVNNDKIYSRSFLVK